MDGLAWRKYPEPDGTDYTVANLRDAAIVEMMFDYCQILEAEIFAEGWQLLFHFHGMAGLISINKRSGWFDDDDAASGLAYCARIAGFDPTTETFGDYDQETGVFTPVS